MALKKKLHQILISNPMIRAISIFGGNLEGTRSITCCDELLGKGS